MKKILIIVMLIVFCSGCSNIKYSLKFDKQIKEYITFKDETHFDEELHEGYMTGMSATEYLFQSLPYNSGSDSNGNYFAGTFYDKNSELENSIIFKYIDENSVKISDKKIFVYITKDSLGQVNDSIKNMEIELYIPYYVSKHNADKVDHNTYTWVIDNIENDKVIINFDTSKPADFMQKIISFSIIGIIVIGIICVIIYFVGKNKKANEI